MSMIKAIIIIMVVAFSLNSIAQNSCDTLPFINCDLNHIINYSKHEQAKNLSKKLYNLNDSNKLTIVHIGDSHLQAGFLTEKIKQELFSYFSNDTMASPGFIFPYTVAQTNNPYFFTVNYSGNWNVCKNIDHEKECNLGISGITVQTNDSLSIINIKMRNEKYNEPLKYYFDNIKIWHNNPNSFNLTIDEKKAKTNTGFSEMQLISL